MLSTDRGGHVQIRADLSPFVGKPIRRVMA
jgi:hypothetical protein